MHHNITAQHLSLSSKNHIFLVLAFHILFSCSFSQLLVPSHIQGASSCAQGASVSSKIEWKILSSETISTVENEWDINEWGNFIQIKNVLQLWLKAIGLEHFMAC